MPTMTNLLRPAGNAVRGLRERCLRTRARRGTETETIRAEMGILVTLAEPSHGRARRRRRFRRALRARAPAAHPDRDRGGPARREDAEAAALAAAGERSPGQAAQAARDRSARNAPADHWRRERINPNFSLAFASLGSISGYACRPDDAIANTEIAIRLNPRDPSLVFRYSTVSLAHFVRGDFVTARDWAQRTVSTKSDWWLGHGLLAASRAHLEDAKGAREAGAELLRLFPKFSINSLPFPAVQDPRHAEVFRAGLRKAGVPDLSGEGVGNPARLEQMAEPRGAALAGSRSRHDGCRGTRRGRVQASPSRRR
jgi:hypothetical protein